MSTSTSPATSSRPIRSVTTSLRILLLGTAGVLLFAISPVGASTHHLSKGVVIATATSKKFGTYLVSGLTLYQFNKSDCSSAKCRKVWPPLLLPKGVTKATAGHGVDAAKLGTTKMSNGKLQVTYGGKALFRFYKDTAPGQVNGDKVSDQWGKWTLYTTVKANSSGTATTTTTGPKSAGTTTTTGPKSGGTTTTTSGSGAGGVTTTTTRPSAPSPTTTTTSPGGGGIAF